MCSKFVVNTPIFAFMLIALSAQAQVVEPSLPTPERIAEILKSDQEAAKRDLAKRLSIVDDSGQPIPSDLQYDSVSLTYAVLEAPGPQAILQVDCQGCWWTFIVVLDESPENVWRHLTTLEIGGKYEKPKVSFLSVVSAQEKQIVLRRNEVFSGTGMWQYNLTVLKLHCGNLEAILDEPEEINFAVPSSNEEGSYNTQQTQNSEFRFASQMNDKAFPQVIYEHQTIKVHDRTVSRWRAFYWSPQLHRYVHIPIDRPEKPLGDLRPLGPPE